MRILYAHLMLKASVGVKELITCILSVCTRVGALPVLQEDWAVRRGAGGERGAHTVMATAAAAAVWPGGGG